MASITLTQAYFHTAGDLSDYDVFDVHAIDGQHRWDADRRVYTSGRLRLVSGATETLDLPVTLRNVTRAGRDALTARGGVLQLLRLPHGYRRYGFFNAHDLAEHLWGDRRDITLTFQEVTVSEAV